MRPAANPPHENPLSNPPRAVFPEPGSRRRLRLPRRVFLVPAVGGFALRACHDLLSLRAGKYRLFPRHRRRLCVSLPRGHGPDRLAGSRLSIPALAPLPRFRDVHVRGLRGRRVSEYFLLRPRLRAGVLHRKDSRGNARGNSGGVALGDFSERLRDSNGLDLGHVLIGAARGGDSVGHACDPRFPTDEALDSLRPVVGRGPDDESHAALGTPAFAWMARVSRLEGFRRFLLRRGLGSRNCALAGCGHRVLHSLDNSQLRGLSRVHSLPVGAGASAVARKQRRVQGPVSRAAAPARQRRGAEALRRAGRSGVHESETVARDRVDGFAPGARGGIIRAEVRGHVGGDDASVERFLAGGFAAHPHCVCRERGRGISGARWNRPAFRAAQ